MTITCRIHSSMVILYAYGNIKSVYQTQISCCVREKEVSAEWVITERVVRNMAFDPGVPFGDLPIVDLCPICICSTHFYLVQIRDRLVLWNGNAESRHGDFSSSWDYRTSSGKKKGRTSRFRIRWPRRFREFVALFMQDIA